MNDNNNSVCIYQLHIRLKDISPMIWRRLLVKNDSTIADLHHYIQITKGWENIHLHQFIIRGVTYGICYEGGISFSDNAREVKLSDFQFHVNERFIYEYDFFDHWEHEIRIEQKLSPDPKKIYPKCTGGKRGAPPEECGGPHKFMELEEDHQPLNMYFTLSDAFEKLEDKEFEKEDIQDIIDDFIEWKER